MSSNDANPRATDPLHLPFAAEAGFGLAALGAGSPLEIRVLPSGALYSIRHRTTLVNQLLPGPAGEGLFRLLLRERASSDSDAPVLRWGAAVGAGIGFRHDGAIASWTSEHGALRCAASLCLHPSLPAWLWTLRVVNDGAEVRHVDALVAQDLGLADEAAVRNNEAYTSHYVDLLPERSTDLGWVLLARQNQAMAGGAHPWLGAACLNGAAAYCTDGLDFFGADHRITGTPAAAAQARLASRRFQYEMATAALQSPVAELQPGGRTEFAFVFRFVEDHPAASGPQDLSLLKEIVDEFEPARAAEPSTQPGPQAESLFQTAPWAHGETPGEQDLAAWFPGQRRHVERATDGSLLSFFCGTDTHVVTRAKEAAILRPHGHILRSGEWRWFDDTHVGLTCYAAGVFAAQAYVGHPSFARLLSVVRNPLNLSRGAGQRVFIRKQGRWRQLGVPSAFAMTPGDARWLYRIDGDVIEARAWCAQDRAAAFLSLGVQGGREIEFLVSHELALGAAEFEFPGRADLRVAEGWAACLPDGETLIGRHQPGVCFAVATAQPGQAAESGGDGLLYADGVARRGPYLVFKSKPTAGFGLVMVGSLLGPGSLGAAVDAARAAFLRQAPPSRPPAPPVTLRGGIDATVGRIDEILPWFAHNAAIHFSAPHGLEQYGGAAWGVRDVCQGSVEWLLASGDAVTVRRILSTVFAQQYPEDGGWPQWFMFPPYRFIQQAHSHGDIVFWPLKALCDYVEASNDLGFLQACVGYTDRTTFVAAGPSESILSHCDRIIAQCERRFIDGTALVNYGDGDWDDTLQPADPSLRTRMVSAWTVGLAYHAFRQYGVVCRNAGEFLRAERVEALCDRMRLDFAAKLMPGGVVAGFLVTESDGSTRPLLHPQDTVTRIRYRLLPMTRSILAELFTPAEARRHLALIGEALSYIDGVRLMSEPATYQGGLERLFKRAETAANVGREIGLQYVHAHLRYAEALAKVGDAEGVWRALQVANPVELAAIVPQAAPRQSNVYFSSSDADFDNRAEAGRRWADLRRGRVSVRGGWRLYSSGPGLFLHKVRCCLLGLRESFDEIIFDPVLPIALDGLLAKTTLCGRPVQVLYRIFEHTSSPRSVTVNGTRCTETRRESNPYRQGGLVVRRSELQAMLRDSGNVVLVEL